MSNTVCDGTLKKVIIEQDGLDTSSAGRGSTSGFVKCSLCNVNSNKVYAFGRGVSMNLHALHPTDDHALTVRDSALSLRAPGFNERATQLGATLKIRRTKREERRNQRLIKKGGLILASHSSIILSSLLAFLC
jgi:hypothetical protein